ncbi:AzlD domain-containing protein [Thalassomonas haliotis]|uniref:AzlD domain-containing protein n=1 Tax=Thalassomonas haliotis TaxID=485448 RepID=A0ABY7VEP5_9GAMM|nr:AzlD domain-containing protein [Thalassomonas haliotis]WDE12149.1 AzlD domain-containing protein [Thalassomonas haliotis]
MTLLTILLLAGITFFTRYLFLHPSLPVKLGPKMEHFLSFSAPAVLTAIWAPIIFVRDGQLNISTQNPYLISASIALLLALKFKKVYLTLGASLMVFTLLKIYT